MSHDVHRALVGLSIAGLAFTASADVFRCTNPTGKVEYRDSPCAPGDASKKLEFAPIERSDETEASRARIARESAEFNTRFDAAHRQPPVLYYYYETVVEREYLAEPAYYAYAGPLCGPACGAKARPTHHHRELEPRRAAPMPKPLPRR